METHHEENEKADRPFLNLKAEAPKKNFRVEKRKKKLIARS